MITGFDLSQFKLVKLSAPLNYYSISATPIERNCYCKQCHVLVGGNIDDAPYYIIFQAGIVEDESNEFLYPMPVLETGISWNDITKEKAILHPSDIGFCTMDKLFDIFGKPSRVSGQWFEQEWNKYVYNKSVKENNIDEIIE